MDLFLTSDFDRQREVQRETGRNDSGQSIELNLFATGSFRAAEASGGRVAEHASGVFRHGLEWSTAPMQCAMADEDERGYIMILFAKEMQRRTEHTKASRAEKARFHSV